MKSLIEANLWLFVLLIGSKALSAPMEFKGWMKNRYDKVYLTPTDRPLVLTDHFKMLVTAEVKALPVENLQIETRWTMTKYFNEWMEQGRGGDLFKNQSTRNFEENTLKVERAFFDYRFLEHGHYLLGRLPTAGGEPTSFMEREEESLSLFPKLATGFELDGMLFSIASSELSTEGLRGGLGYFPFMLYNFQSRRSAIGGDALVNNGTVETENLAPMGVVFLDYRKPDVFGSKTLRLQLFHSWLNYLRVPDLTLQETALGGTGIDTVGITSNLSFFLKTYLLHLSVHDLHSLPLDISFSYLVTQTNSEGDAVVSSGTTNFPNGTTLGGWGTSESKDESWGEIFLGALRFKYLGLYGTRETLGFEYLNGSKSALFLDQVALDSTRFYETKGEAYHLYWTKELTKSASDLGLEMRLGWRHQFLRWSPTFIGPIVDQGAVASTVYMQMSAYF